MLLTAAAVALVWTLCDAAPQRMHSPPELHAKLATDDGLHEVWVDDAKMRARFEDHEYVSLIASKHVYIVEKSSGWCKCGYFPGKPSESEACTCRDTLVKRAPVKQHANTKRGRQTWRRS